MFGFLRKSIRSSLHFSEFSLNLLSFENRRTWFTVSNWIFAAPDVGTISETVVSSANFRMAEKVFVLVIYHDQEKPWTDAGPLWNSSGDWDELPPSSSKFGLLDFLPSSLFKAFLRPPPPGPSLLQCWVSLNFPPLLFLMFSFKDCLSKVLSKERPTAKWVARGEGQG